MPTRVGIDSGGTFTDAVAVSPSGEVRVTKIASTPADPAEATIAAYCDVTQPGEEAELCHGTTVPTNTLLERRGARTALITNEGFGDLIEIGRQRRPALYDSQVDRPEPLVPPELRFEVAGRISAGGDELTPLTMGDLEEKLDAARPEAIAICLLHAYANDAHERALVERLGDRRFMVASSAVANEFREFERTSTALMNAYLGPGTSAYLQRLADCPELPEALLVMRSSGGLTALRELATQPADALLSGPAAGALAAAAVARQAGFATAVGFDMGGTSTDVVLIRNGRPELRAMTTIAGLPCLAPALAVHTVGAGGGSLASFDQGDALRVGPQSAGAIPGPVAYARGGTRPTVTDANVALGRVRELVGGRVPLDAPAARAAVEALGTGAAQSILEVVEAHMERALREVTVHRGVDPADAALVAFGGAGALHAAQLCRHIGARCVIVPPLAGLLSAVGLLTAPLRADRARTAIQPADTLDAADFGPLEEEVERATRWTGTPETSRSVDCRYRGQSHEITVEFPCHAGNTELIERFHAAHEERNGYRRPEATVEAVTLRAVAEVASELNPTDVLGSLHLRGRAGMHVGEIRAGATLLTEDQASIWVPPDFRIHLDKNGNFVLEPI